jgi:hypothetical protein
MPRTTETPEPRNEQVYSRSLEETDVPEHIETTTPDGVDYGWVMQVTFVATILVGAPVVAVLSLGTALETWMERAVFAIRVGAVIWVITAISVFLYARRTQT